MKFIMTLLFSIFASSASVSSSQSTKDSQITQSNSPQTIEYSTKPNPLIVYADKYQWKYGSTLLGFFAQNNIPESIYFNLPAEDKEVIADVKTDSDIYILRDSTGKLLQAYLSLNADMQVKISLDTQNSQDSQAIKDPIKPKYNIKITPILSLSYEQKVIARIEDGGSPSKALYNATQDARLNQEFLNAYKERRIVQKGDRIIMLYDRKVRLGKYIGTPDVKALAVESNKRLNYLFNFKNRYYDENGRQTASFFLIVPVKYIRISSKFSSGRRHPVLGYVRPHYGVDFAAPGGTPVYAASNGNVTYAGYRGGYGNVIEIKHEGGIKTLYAHLSKIKARLGSQVRQGVLIGNVGTTGLSTGPHLHFGVYKDSKPINPLGQIKTAKNELKQSEKKIFKGFVESKKSEIQNLIANADLTNNSFVIERKLIESSGDVEDNDE